MLLPHRAWSRLVGSGHGAVRHVTQCALPVWSTTQVWVPGHTTLEQDSAGKHNADAAQQPRAGTWHRRPCGDEGQEPTAGGSQRPRNSTRERARGRSPAWPTGPGWDKRPHAGALAERAGAARVRRGRIRPRAGLGAVQEGGGGFVHPQPAGPVQPAAPMAPAPHQRGGTAGPGVLPGRCKHCLKPSLLLPLFSCRIGRRLGICNSQLATHISCPKFYCAVQSLTGKAFQRGGLAKIIIIILTVLGRGRRITALFNKTTKKGLDVWK